LATGGARRKLGKFVVACTQLPKHTHVLSTVVDVAEVTAYRGCHAKMNEFLASWKLDYFLFDSGELSVEVEGKFW
jgi:hypothetical protein